MEPPKENQFPYYPQQQQQQQHHHPQSSAAAQPSNVVLPNTHQGSSEGMYPHSVVEPAKRKRGRPRKYATPEHALAAKKAASSASNEGSGFGAGASPSSSCSKKSQFDASGQGFTPHIIDVVAGEDVTRKILVFVQQSKHEICVLSASGSVANPTLCQSAASGGNITYEGEFEIVSLSGSYIHNEVGGRKGGISVCLSSTDGQFIGGVVAGPLNATGPVQIIVGTFLVDTEKDAGAGAAQGGDAMLPSGVVSSLGFRYFDSSGRNTISSRSNEDDQTIRSSHFMPQPQPLDMIPPHHTDWSSCPARYDDMTDTK